MRVFNIQSGVFMIVYFPSYKQLYNSKKILKGKKKTKIKHSKQKNSS